VTEETVEPTALPANAPVFERTHDDPLMLPKQPAGVVPAERLTGYRIEQRLDDVAGTIHGHVVIRFANPTGKPLTKLPLLLHPNASAELGAEGASLVVTRVQRIQGGVLAHREVRPTLVTVDFVPAIPAKESVTIRVDYQGQLRRLSTDANDMLSQVIGSLESMAGDGAADYGLLAVGDGIMTVASAYPMVAPYRDGSFDTGPPAKTGDLAYNDVADFEVITRVPRGMLLVTNLVDDTPEAARGGWMKVVSKGSHVRDFVLVGGRDLQRSHLDVDDTRITSVYRGRDAEGGKRALAMAASSLRAFERRFGDYPYRELDVVEASLVGGVGGVEFNAMVLVAGMLCHDPLQGSPLGGILGEALGPMKDQLSMTFDFTVAHEVAHQYFAGIVGNDSHRFPSLDEPMAQYAAGLAIEDRYGKAAAERAMDAHVKMNYAVYRMLGGSDQPVLRDVRSFRTPAEYAALVYGKAPYVYVELRRKLGDARLHKAIRAAVDEHRFGLVTTEEWISSLEKATGSREVRPTFSRWLRQTHADADLKVDASGTFVLERMLPSNLQGGPVDVRALLKSMLDLKAP
jgi:peptidase M1-like protein